MRKRMIIAIFLNEISIRSARFYFVFGQDYILGRNYFLMYEVFSDWPREKSAPKKVPSENNEYSRKIKTSEFCFVALRFFSLLP